MCGLVSIFSSGNSLDGRLPLLSEMLNVLAHRGPDGEGVHHVSNRALLGHRRLAVIDKINGQQPMVTADGRYCLVYNGEIYNFRSLKEELSEKGIIFYTESDTEVLLNLLIHYGEKAIPRLNGMFAFVFYDRHENRWLAARDHFGIKPLYFVETGAELVFASEIKALLLHPEVEAVRDERSLHQYLAFQFCLDERTLFAGIKKLKPGHYLSGEGNVITKEVCYWDTSYQIDQSHSEYWFNNQLQELLADSISLQMNADVDVGAYVSGGLDSSLVASIASDHGGQPLPIFHGKFAEGEQYDESQYAQSLSEHIGGDYREVIPTAGEFVDQLPELIYMLDEPIAGPGLFPQYAVSKLASKHVTVVLGGQGGDEIFGGYARYLLGYLEQALKGAILETQEEGKHLVTLESIIPNLAILKEYTPLLRHFWSQGVFNNMDERYFHLIDRSQGVSHLLHPDAVTRFNREQLFSDFQAIFNHPDTTSYINKMTHFDQKSLLPALLQIEDRVSMSVSIESRVPLLDKRIVDLVTSMPPALKFQGGQTKHILKKAVRNNLPEEILGRKDKMGFPVPLVEWMKGGPVRDFVSDTLLSQRSIERGGCNPASLRAMIDNQGVGGRQLWGALSLELWHQRFIAAA